MIIVASKPGQLGNRLFVFAYFIASVLEHNIPVINLAFDEYAQYFPATSQDLLGHYPSRRSLIKPSAAMRKGLYQLVYYAGRIVAKSGLVAKRLRTITIGWDEIFELDDPKFLSSIKPWQLVFMQGWQFTNRAALSKHAAAVKKFFQPAEEHRANVAALIQRARADTDLLVGVHIRHGYIHFDSHRQYWNPPEKYAEMMGEFAALFPGTRIKFLICSDAKQDPSVFAGFQFIFGNDHVIEDMYAFAQCDYIFGPPSTYTMWASFYGEVPLRLVADASKPMKLEDFTLFRDFWHPADA